MVLARQISQKIILLQNSNTIYLSIFIFHFRQHVSILTTHYISSILDIYILSWEYNYHRVGLGFSVLSHSLNNVPTQYQKSYLLGISFSYHAIVIPLYLSNGILGPLDEMHKSYSTFRICVVGSQNYSFIALNMLLALTSLYISICNIHDL